MMKLLILGAGFAGCSAAHLLKKKGFEITVLERAKLPGGGCRTNWYGGHPYTFGPRIFFTRDEEVIKVMTGLVKIRQFYNKTWTYVAEDGQFYNYPIFANDLSRMPDWPEIKKQLAQRKDKTPSVQSFEAYWLQAIGPNLYHKFVDRYSKKMWGIESNRDLSANFNWVNRGNPIRQKDARLYEDMFQGYPVAPDGYNQFFAKALKGCRFIPECEIESFDAKSRKVKTSKGEFTGQVIINTISVDGLFKNVFGVLRYCGRKFLKIVLPVEKVLPKDLVWIHYAGEEPFTRVTEFKKITNHKSRDTLLGVEMPALQGQYYPVQIEEEILRFKKYQELFPKNFYSIGRLGSFMYKGIPDDIRDALDMVKKITD